MADQIGRVGIIGGGSAAEALCRELAGSAALTVYEPHLVGGECPFVACMPSKAMLHIARQGGSWTDAVAHRDDVAAGRSDAGHVDELESMGVAVRRAFARLDGCGRIIDTDGGDEQFDHVVIATGAEPITPDTPGIDDSSHASRVWTSRDLYTAEEQPASVIVLGGGVIGCEAAELLARFGTEVSIVERNDRLFDLHPPAVSEVVAGSLVARGVDLRLGCSATAVSSGQGDVVVELDDGSQIAGEVLLVAVGRRSRTDGIGLATIGIDGDAPLPIDGTGRLDADGSHWVIGDAAGRGEYTHLANHQALVVADHLAGTGTRRFDDVAVAACMFTDPPLIHVGPTWRELRGDDDVVTRSLDLAEFPRALTDRHGQGHLWVAARRSTGSVVAAAGVGASFDELIHALVIAVDHEIPVAQLRRSLRPFPTVGEILGSAWDRLHDLLDRRSTI